jgi:uncharacterized protein (UPF0179 family)
MPYTLARLIEDGFLYTGKRKHCRDCGMWLYCFTLRGGNNRWFSIAPRVNAEDDEIYLNHNIRACDRQRAIRSR